MPNAFRHKATETTAATNWRNGNNQVAPLMCFPPVSGREVPPRRPVQDGEGFLHTRESLVRSQVRQSLMADYAVVPTSRMIASAFAA